ncbi:epidermal growth factor receptor kinase substrate 8-like protein 3 [Lingula anatina]|uniref:Epidermal growth factor receptor kinase substrate 8-like protein 3 n=1 Tax=Lingula anatina TaxID=7574 RepID=A0A1S3HTH8_LINAN|nr:epidermal growth factor receptor kinase substrate 8-like protein 3 [Lingula anatina]|eukprot:XP_013388364.1 epidermal growth factor receptor kinase substrate 8-like protein 3 [Lingula anatina]
MPAPGQFQKCGWGVFGLESWQPLDKTASNSAQVQQSRCSDPSGLSATAAEPHAGRGDHEEEPVDSSREQPTGKKLLAKYSYKAAEASPLGKLELSITQGEHLFLVEKHGTEEHWWLVRNGQGQTGYVPASYMMVLDDMPTSLPWLQNRAVKQPTTAPGPYKPYVSAYAKSSPDSASQGSDQYYCKVCDKQLNGPKPYSAHMNSRDHRENVEYYGEDGPGY